MKRKMTAIIAGTMLAITGAMPASATVVNTNSQALANARNHSEPVVVAGLTKEQFCKITRDRRYCRKR